MEVAGQQQQWRIPAFGEWNYGQYDYGIDGCRPLTPCFDVVAVRMINTLPAPKPIQRARTKGNARARRVPAFGEWNHSGDSTWTPAAATTPFFDLAAGQKPPEKERRSGGGGGAAEAMRRSAEAYGRGRSKVADSGDCAARKPGLTVVPKAVDDDLYRVPSDVFYQKPARRRGRLRFLLMAGCFFCQGGTNTA